MVRRLGIVPFGVLKSSAQNGFAIAVFHFEEKLFVTAR
jgi:hypothetical protein